MNPARLLFPVVLFLPLAAAAAEPVRITTQMNGQLDAFPTWLERMGFGDYWDRSGPLPFSLTIASVIDPDDVQEWCSDNWCYSVPASVSYSLTVDGKTIDFADSNHVATIAWSSSSFLNGTYYRTDPYPSVSGSFVSIDAWVQGPEGSFGADPFRPQRLGGAAVTGYLDISVSPLDPETPGLWVARGDPDSVSFQVSVVPEPAGAGMLAAGLSALALAGRRRRKPGARPA